MPAAASLPGLDTQPPRDASMNVSARSKEYKQQGGTQEGTQEAAQGQQIVETHGNVLVQGTLNSDKIVSSSRMHAISPVTDIELPPEGNPSIKNETPLMTSGNQATLSKENINGTRKIESLGPSSTAVRNLDQRTKAFSLEVALGNGRTPQWRMIMVQAAWKLDQLVEHACIICGVDDNDVFTHHHPKLYSVRLRLDEVISIRQLEDGDKILLCPDGGLPVPYVVLATGNNRSGQLGLGDFQGRHQIARVAQPILPLCGLQVVQVACGTCHTLLLTKDGQVLSFGNGRNGRLGYDLPYSVATSSDNGFTSLMQSPQHLTDQQHLQLAPRRVEFPDAVRVRHISCGNAYSMVAACPRASHAKEGNMLFAFGSGGPWLGLGKTRGEDVIRPSLVCDLTLDDNEAIREIACGRQHTLCCSTKGRCWSWGKNNDDGKLGHVLTSSHGEPMFLTLDEMNKTVYADQRPSFVGLRVSRSAAVAAASSSPMEQTMNLVSKLHMHALVPGQKLPRAEFGTCFLAEGLLTGLFDALTGENLEALEAEPDHKPRAQSLLFVHADEADSLIPRVIGVLQSYDIVHVAAGQHHSLFVSADGLCFACGSNQVGQLGLGADLLSVMTQSQISVPSLVNIPVKVKSVTAGAFHSVALGKNNRVYTWGHSELIGRPDGDPYMPSEIMFEGGPLELVRSMAAGQSHTVLVTAFGHCIGFGSNNCCQLGTSEPSSLIESPSLIEMPHHGTDASGNSQDKACKAKTASTLKDLPPGTPDFSALDPKNDENLIITGVAAGGGLAPDTGHTVLLSSSLLFSRLAPYAFSGKGHSQQSHADDRSSNFPAPKQEKVNRNFCVALQSAWVRPNSTPVKSSNSTSATATGKAENNDNDSTCTMS